MVTHLPLLPQTAIFSPAAIEIERFSRTRCGAFSCADSRFSWSAVTVLLYADGHSSLFQHEHSTTYWYDAETSLISTLLWAGHSGCTGSVSSLNPSEGTLSLRALSLVTAPIEVSNCAHQRIMKLRMSPNVIRATRLTPVKPDELEWIWVASVTTRMARQAAMHWRTKRSQR